MGLFQRFERQWERLWPSACLICHRWPAEMICQNCIATFAQPQPRCSLCALALFEGHRCPAQARPDHPTEDLTLYSETPSPLQPLPQWHLDASYCAVDYQYPWSVCTGQLKFSGHASLARALASLMRHAPHIEHAIERADALIPIPIARARLIERGFNQSIELARHLLEKPQRHKLNTAVLLRKEGMTHQIGADRQQRWDNLQQAFTLAPNAAARLQRQHLILLDDVMTTGATLNEAARLLKQAGAASVTALVFARTPWRAAQDSKSQRQ